MLIAAGVMSIVVEESSRASIFGPNGDSIVSLSLRASMVGPNGDRTILSSVSSSSSARIPYLLLSLVIDTVELLFACVVES